jgi:hypothetical protein
MVEPHTEADPAGLLLHFLTSFGNMVGGGPHALADGSRHPAKLNALLVGRTSRARKTTTTGQIHGVTAEVDPEWTANRVMGGIGSGEGIIAAVADTDDDAPQDKRLLVVESEFARVLAVCAREGSTASAIIREAWDSDRLRVMTRREPLIATGVHVSLLGHITEDELRKRTTETDANNGLLNRFLFGMVRRTKLLPDGGQVDRGALEAFVSDLRPVLTAARKVGTLRRTPEAADLWNALYRAMADDDPGGLVGAVTARAEAQVLRLSVAYALTDGSNLITADHLTAAYAVWRYSAASAAWIFGDSIGDDVADRLLVELRKRPEGMTGTDQQRLFGRHVPKARITDALALLERKGLARTVEEQTGGRPRRITTATASKAKEASNREDIA